MERKFSLQDFGIGVISGLALGAIAGVLLAPESGESTRERIVMRAGGMRMSAQDLVDNAKTSLDMAVSKLDGVFSDQERSLRKRLGRLKEELEKYNLSGA